MRFTEVLAWAEDMVRHRETEAFGVGALAVIDGQFNESACAAPGSDLETDYCEGGRETLRRIRQCMQPTAPARRIQHGDIVETTES